MKKLFYTLFLLTFTAITYSQINLDVEGKAKIGEMVKDNSADSVVVRLSDGTLAVRDASTLNNNQTSPWYLGKDTLGGIVFYIYTGSDGLEHGLIVDTIESTAQWQTNATLVGANRTWDGAYNTDRMDVNGPSPAKDWVDARSAVLPGEWYLPSLDELGKLWENRFHVNLALFEGDHTLLSTAGYWTSTEANDIVARVFFLLNGAGGDNKTSVHTVRAIRSF